MDLDSDFNSSCGSWRSINCSFFRRNRNNKTYRKKYWSFRHDWIWENSIPKNLQGEGEKYQLEGYQGTNKAEYQKFTFKIGDKHYEIKDGIDIGGETYNIKPYYEKFLENKDICIFLFDVQKYKDNSEYRKDTNVRLDFINSHVKDASKCAIIGSHVDKAKIEEGQSIITIVQKLVEGKQYARLLNTNFFAYNLTSEEDMNKLLNKLFL